VKAGVSSLLRASVTERWKLESAVEVVSVPLSTAGSSSVRTSGTRSTPTGRST
jgi:hypothetical protein